MNKVQKFRIITITLVIANIATILSIIALQYLSLTGRAVCFITLTIAVIVWINIVFKIYHNKKFTKEEQLERLRKRSNIDKFHRNVILFIIPIIVISYYSIDSISNQEYNKKIRNYFSVSKLIINNSDSKGILVDYIDDPIISRILDTNTNRNSVIAASLMIDVSTNSEKTLQGLSMLKKEVSGENVSDKDKRSITAELMNSNNNIQSVYNSLKVDENKLTNVDALIYTAREINLKLLDVNINIMNLLKTSEDKEDNFKETLSLFKEAYKDKEKFITSLEELIDKESTKIVVNNIIYVIGLITLIFSIIRILEITTYYIKINILRKKTPIIGSNIND